MPSPNFERAINDLDHARQPGAMQDARIAILQEIREVTQRTPGVSPEMIVNKINQVENDGRHAGNDVRLVHGNGPNGPYLDVQPIGYPQQQRQGYPPQGGYAPSGYPQEGYAPPPPPGAYPQAYGQPPIIYENQNPVPPIVGGVVAGVLLDRLLHRR